jgi:hypothetical protein
MLVDYALLTRTDVGLFYLETGRILARFSGKGRGAMAGRQPR